MKIYKLLLLAIVATSLLLPAAARAVGIEIQVGDRPYYNHGAQYWQGDYQMVWIPGHMSGRHHWVHGQYVRGEHRHGSNFRHEDQRNDYRDDSRR